MKPVQKTYGVYIFDFDMTLSNSLKGAEKAYSKAFGAAGVPFDRTLVPTYIRESLDHTADRYLKSPCARREFIAAFITESQRSMGANTELFPEVPGVLRGLKENGSRLSIASGKKSERIIEILDQYDLTYLFDRIVGYGDVPRSKPAPDSLLECMSYYNLPKNGFCYVGDSPYDMQAAEAAGIDGICIVRGFQPTSACRGDISDLRQLLP